MTSDAPQGGVRLLGTLRAEGGTGVVRMEDRFDAAVDTVWSALTDRGRLAIWLGEIVGRLHPGGDFSARFHASGWEGTGRIETCDPPLRLKVRTKDSDGLAEGTIEVTLEAEGDRTAVVWEERGMPADLLPAYGAGIQIHLEDLRDHITGAGRRDAGPRFDALFASYQEL